MPSRRHLLIGATALGASAALPAFAQGADRPNPMPEDLRKAIERDPNAPVLGNPEGNLTLTEFFDYNCPFCRQMVGVVQQLISSDPQLRVVYREWPVFGEGSEFAARASLASLRQGKYWQFHAALMAMKDRAAEASVMRIARQIGLDVTKLRADMERPEIDEHITTSFQLADHMGLMGTPTFIAGDEAVFGRMSLKEAQDLVARGRKTLGV
ncbi:DsbA family protein [Paracoccus zhejiangensis]|uniref:Fis family transcriptional regulator n=1 Tax=Paracoccus zhejiangensis TaxID=1077935 RepID=A0A2H5EZ37_9RHOB|nr:DsbA family protein [Paracoccus zhejiangensis]AUH64561.1 Fis family transcriptional regulator [Paracoccus zhejiangensis]